MPRNFLSLLIFIPSFFIINVSGTENKPDLKKLVSNTIQFISINNPLQSISNPIQPVNDSIQPKPFLDSLKRATFLYFKELAGPDNGLIPDRGPNPKAFSSIAATGFGLTALLVGVENKFITRHDAALQVLKTLKFFGHSKQDGSERSNTTGYKGFYYHFLKMENGLRYKEVELSTIDTGLLMMGILSCESYFDAEIPEEIEIRHLALLLYSRVDWNWASKRNNLICMGWKPESGFLSSDYKGYDEASFLYILALGSPTHALTKSSWTQFTSTNNWGVFNKESMINFGPLFGHQYTQCWLDMKGLKDDFMRSKGIDYFENSRRATYANRSYCIENPKRRKDYTSNIWGLTACDGPGDAVRFENGLKISYMGYSARGAALAYQVDDGTIAPTAAGGSIAFAPEICIPTLISIKNKYGSLVYHRYGFIDAFNPSFIYHDPKGWFDPESLGIDEGPILLMAENHQSAFIWNLMKKNPHIIKGLKSAGFSGAWLDKQSKMN